MGSLSESKKNDGSYVKELKGDKIILNTKK